MAQEVLIYLSIIITISAVMAVIARMIRQPPIIAYLVSGVLVGPLFFNLMGSGDSSLIQTFSRIGVAFLLFIVGLSLDFRLLKEIGKVSTITGLIEIILVTGIGFLVSLWLGFTNIEALYIGAVIAFSSTVVVVKILSDKRELHTLHGRISIGILIIQDIVASIALMVVPLMDSGGRFNIILTQIGIGILLIAIVFLVSVLIFHRFLNYLAKSQEALFIFGIAWALVISTIFFKLGFSIEIGALIAGMSLASSKYALDLEGKMKPLRDFFMILFFVFFGSQLTGPIGGIMIRNALILSALVMIVKPIIVMFTLKLFGYTKKTNFLTALSLAQVSEFSLVLILLGFGLGQVSPDLMNLSVLIALITIFLSTYGLNFSEYLSHKLLKFLNFFEGKVHTNAISCDKCYDIILFGYHRIGYKLFETIKKGNLKLLIVDYNPKVVESLVKRGIDCFYGDAGNKHFLKEIGLDKAKIVISTLPDYNSNLMILEAIKELKSKAIFIGTSEDPRIALNLYEAGADYVIVPHHLGGEYAANLIKEFGTNKGKYHEIGKRHFINLKKGKLKSNYS